MLEVKNMTVTYGEYKVVNNVSFSLAENRWLMLVGPNGAGKSTVVSAIAQSVKYAGEVYIKGENAAKMKPTQLAQNIGLLSQYHYVSYPFTVEEVVRLGRYSYSGGMFTHNDDKMDEEVEKALAVTGLDPLRSHSVLNLSGGELQRVFLAQIFAQDPQILILDEPTNHLDLVYQKQIFGLINEWIQKPGRAVIAVVHDLSLAKAYGTDAMLLDHGRCVSLGDVEKVLSRDNLREVYSLDVYAWMRQMLSQWEDKN